MGNSRMDNHSWQNYSSSNIQGQSTNQIYTSRNLKDDLNPTKIRVRESFDSVLNPESTAIIIGLDTTASMNDVLDSAVRSLGTFVTNMYEMKPITDPHVMFMGVGDVFCTRAPLQVTQFEADIKIAEQLTNIWLEGGGGGNGEESYTLPWYFAARHTDIDCFNKRNKKGYIFTVGDDGPSMIMPKNALERFIGDEPEKDYSAKELLEMVSEKYNIFHIHLSRHHGINQKWIDLLGENAFELSDVTKLSEAIISRIQLDQGMSPTEIMSHWDESVHDTIQESINLRR